jgi:hypothetical protein
MGFRTRRRAGKSGRRAGPPLRLALERADVEFLHLERRPIARFARSGSLSIKSSGKALGTTCREIP